MCTCPVEEGQMNEVEIISGCHVYDILFCDEWELCVCFKTGDVTMRLRRCVSALPKR